MNCSRELQNKYICVMYLSIAENFTAKKQISIPFFVGSVTRYLQ